MFRIDKKSDGVIVFEINSNPKIPDDIQCFIKSIEDKKPLKIIISDNQSYCRSLYAVDNYKYGNDLMLAFAETLKANPKLESLEISGCWYGIDGLINLCEELKINNTLQHFKINRMSYQGKGAVNRNGVAILADMLAMNKSILSLDLSHNDFSSKQEAKCFAPMLSKNTSLVSLNLSHVYLGLFGVKGLAKGLVSNNSLQRLDLSFPHLPYPNVNLLADALGFNKSLTSLCLEINFDNLEYFAKAFSNNTSLVMLNLEIYKCKRNKIFTTRWSISNLKQSRVEHDVLKEIENNLNRNQILKDIIGKGIGKENYLSVLPLELRKEVLHYLSFSIKNKPEKWSPTLFSKPPVPKNNNRMIGGEPGFYIF